MPTITVDIDQMDHSASEGSVRNHSMIMDRPEAKGGQNKGPMGGEALLLGLGGCFMSNLLAAAVARDMTLENAKAEISGELADGPARFTDIHMKVTAQGATGEALKKLTVIAERGCIVANTLKHSVNLVVEVG